MANLWVFTDSPIEITPTDYIYDDDLAYANNWTLNGGDPGAAGLPGPGDTVSISSGVTAGSLTVGAATGYLNGGSLTVSSVYDDMLVYAGDLTISQGETLGQATQLDDFGGDITVQGSLTVNPGFLKIYSGTVTVDGDLDVDDTAGGSRGTLLMGGGTLDVTGTATFGEHSHVSDQVLVDGKSDDTLVTIEAMNLVFGSQTVATGATGVPTYTGVTFEDLLSSGTLQAQQNMTVNTNSYVTVGGTSQTAGAKLTIGGTLYDYGVVSSSGVIFVGKSVRLGDGSFGSATGVNIGGGTSSPAGGASIQAGGSLIGFGTLSTVQTGTTSVGASQTVATYSSIINNGTIEAQNGVLQLLGGLSGAGTVTIDAHASLELGGSLNAATTITFADPGSNPTVDPEQLILDNPSYFISPKTNGALTGLQVGDQIVLDDTYAANGNAVYGVTIGNLNGKQTLEIQEAASPSAARSVIFIPISGANGASIPTSGDDADYFQVTTNARQTILTLQQGQAGDLAVNGPTARQTDGVTGAGITVGVISDSFNSLGGEAADIGDDALPAATEVLADTSGNDEGRAMAEIIHAIAPGAAIEFYDSGDSEDDMANAITALHNAGADIIVDDISFTDETNTGSPIENAIASVVADGVTYVTSDGNFRTSGPNGGAAVATFGHATDPLALSVAAMNVLATPNPPSQVGGSLTAQTEAFSSVGKVDITAPDQLTTTMPLTTAAGSPSSLNPFSGTSAASPEVAAVAALMMQENPALETDPLLVYQILEQTAYDFGESAAEMGAGLVQAPGAVAAAAKAVTYVFSNNGSPSSPAVKSFAIAPSAGDIDTGATAEIILTMTQAVTVAGGTPDFKLNDGGLATYDAALSNLSSGVLAFDYLVGAADITSSLELTSYQPNGAAVTNGSGVAADFSAALNVATGLSVNSPLHVESVASSVTGSASAGEVVKLTLDMSGAVTLSTAGGAPTLWLDDGVTALYDAAASNLAQGKLTFDYTVGADDHAVDLAAESVSLPSGSTVRDANGYNADFSLAKVDHSFGLSIGPAFVESVQASETGEASTGQTILLTIDMSEAVTVNTSSGSPTLTLNDGGKATYDAAASKPSSGVLVFSYTIGSADQTSDLAATALVPNGASILDPYGHEADFAGAYGFDVDLSVNLLASPTLVLDLPSVTYASTLETVYRPAAGSGTLKIISTSGGAALDTLSLSQSYDDGFFSLASAASGGTDVDFMSSPFTDVGGAGDVVVSGVSNQAYFAYQEVYQGGRYSGLDEYFTKVVDPYSAFEYDYSNGGALLESRFFYSGVPAGADYDAYEYDYNGAGEVIRAVFSGVADAPYSSYEYDYVGGAFAGSKFTYTTLPNDVSYSSYEVDYNQADAFAGDRFFSTDVTGQSYTGEEEDFDADDKLSRVLLSGVQDQAYSSLELDYSAGIYEGYKAYYAVTGQAYTNVEVDVSASDKIEKAIYSGMTSTPYSSVEEDYSNGAIEDVIYGYTAVTGQTYNAYQVKENASGAGLQETFDLNSGSHTLIALLGGQTLTSLGNDKMTGDGATTFALDAVYGADTITNFTGADTISLPTSEFANFSAVTKAATQSGANVLITASDHDTLTLKNLTTTALAGMSGNFTFHA